MKTSWNLKLFYQSDDDPQIQKDLQESTDVTQSFINKYKGSSKHLTDELELFQALTDFENLVKIIDAPKPFIYYYLKKYLNSSDNKVESRVNQLTEFYTKLENEILFFTLELGQLPEARQKAFLKSSKLEHFRYFLKTTFDEAKHHLSEKEERIMNLKSQPSSSLWVSGGEKIINRQTVTFKGKELPLPEAINKIPTLDPKNRRRLHERVMAALINVSDYAENELNAIVINKKINDELRGFAKPYDARFLGDEVMESEIMAMIDAVTESYKISHRFYDMKFKLLRLRKPQYSDRSAEFGEFKKKFTFKDSVKILTGLYKDTGDGLTSVFNRFLEGGQLDVKPKKGKAGGAFCLGTLGNPTVVLLNHIDNYDSLRTFAHEMGHAFHSELSKSQTPLYQYYSTASAEVASTLFEDLLFDKVFETANEEEKKILIHSKLNNDISSIFRQVAVFNFEMELHKRIREEGSLSKEQMAELMNKHMQGYLGPKFKLTKEDGYYFVDWSHIRSFFYVYSYAYGKLISKYLYQRYKQDKSYWSEIEKFLSAGGSKSPHDIFMEIGIDTYDENFWLEGLKGIEKEIEEFEELLKK